MNAEDALARYAAICDEWAGLLVVFMAEDPDPLAIDGCHARLAELTRGLDTVQATPAEALRLRDAAAEAERLARAVAAAAIERRDALTAEQAQAQRTRGALDAYRPDETGGGSGTARYVDRRT